MNTLGDLTGIKKHFCRKHGDKRWSCERCSKKYAVHSDLKAHLKICGSKEYRCDCSTLFSRRDSFIKHRAFCDALAEESSRALPVVSSADNHENPAVEIQAPPPLAPSANVLSPALSIQISEIPEKKNDILPPITSSPNCSNNAGSGSHSVFASLFASSERQPPSFSPGSASEPTSLSLYLSNGGASSIFRSPTDHFAQSPQPAISATALLQKAAQMGSAASTETLLRGFGLAMSSSSGADRQEQWSGHVKQERDSGAYSDPPTDHMMGTSSLFGSRPTTVDFLGLGMGGGGGSTGGLSALLTSFGGAGGCFNASGGQYSDGGGGRSCSPESNTNSRALH